MAEWDMAPDHWPQMDVSYKKVSEGACLKVTMRIADEPDLGQVEALIEPVLQPRLVDAGIPHAPELGIFNDPAVKVRIPSAKEDLFWVVSVSGRRLYESLHADDPQAFYKSLRTLKGAISEAEVHLANLLHLRWQNHLAMQFGREALSDFDCPE